ncbi:hypothetical protein [Verminephrobacter aporrectodeae]|uniref:hypothetical protein n=1 Tax=Verminephrobacter aporrectodeae TaxID=1110389 RepID=UPI0022379E73|nr:hypothetical protein [Verminephrobacter aporrectodeae]
MKTADFEAVKIARRVAHSRFDHYFRVMAKAKPAVPERNEADTQRPAANKLQKK